jgi:hypothetical protein
MDPYITSLALGAAGLGFMALSGLGARGHAGGAHGHAGAHGHSHGHADTAQPHQGHAPGHAHADGAGQLTRTFWAVTSPRFVFSFLLGFGLAGELLRDHIGGGALAVAAVAGAVIFERAIVAPLWGLAMRFASKPAQTLESAVADEAVAVTGFDANGQGIVSVEVDGQVVQILATLQQADRQLGIRVRAGQRVRIEDVNAAANRCTVSLL